MYRASRQQQIYLYKLKNHVVFRTGLMVIEILSTRLYPPPKKSNLLNRFNQTIFRLTTKFYDRTAIFQYFPSFSMRVYGVPSAVVIIQQACNQCLSPHELESRSWRGVLDTTLCDKKSLKIPKGSSESVNRRRTDNTMAKRKSTKGQTTKYKTKYRVIRTPLKTGGDLIWSGRVSSSCSTSGTRRVNLVTNSVISHE